MVYILLHYIYLTTYKLLYYDAILYIKIKLEAVVDYFNHLYQV